MQSSRLTVGIPAWNGSLFLAECIASLRAQSHADFQAVVSIDRSSDDSAAVARRAVHGDPRFRIVQQRNRLGWIGNCNFLLEHAGSEWFSLLPQDDLLASDYLETLLEKAADAPGAAVVYTDLETFGADSSWVIEQESLRGPVVERVLGFLRHHFNAVAFRGLVRGELARSHPLEHGASGGFAADTLWLLDLAVAGDLVRVPVVAYRKRVHGQSMVARWKRWQPAEARDAWIRHCVASAERVLHRPWSARHGDALHQALEDRLLQRHAPLWPAVAPPEPSSDLEIRRWQTALVEDFRSSLAAHAGHRSEAGQPSAGQRGTGQPGAGQGSELAPRRSVKAAADRLLRGSRIARLLARRG